MFIFNKCNRLEILYKKKTYFLSGHVHGPPRPLAPAPIGINGHMSKNYVFLMYTNIFFIS